MLRKIFQKRLAFLSKAWYLINNRFPLTGTATVLSRPFRGISFPSRGRKRWLFAIQRSKVAPCISPHGDGNCIPPVTESYTSSSVTKAQKSPHGDGNDEDDSIRLFHESPFTGMETVYFQCITLKYRKSSHGGKKDTAQCAVSFHKKIKIFLR